MLNQSTMVDENICIKLTAGGLRLPALPILKNRLAYFANKSVLLTSAETIFALEEYVLEQKRKEIFEYLSQGKV